MKFGSKYVFTLLFLITGASALYMGAMVTAKWIMYIRYENVTEGAPTHYDVLSLTDDKHHIRVNYNFELGKEKFQGQYIYLKTHYPTKEAAFEAIEDLKTEDLTVWYWRGKEGAPIAILERVFPKNELVRFCVVLGILFYFGFLRNSLYRFSMDESVST